MACHDFEVIPPDLLQYASPSERKAYEAALFRCVTLASPLDFSLAMRPETEDFRHSRLVSNKIASLEPGGKLLITMPPRAGKSFTVSEAAPAWAIASDPNNRVGHATYGHDFTVTFGRQIRRMLLDGRRFGATPRLDPAAKAVDMFFVHPNDGRGFYFADGVGGGFTGRGFDWLFLDDLIKNDEEAQSQVIRDKTWQWIIRVALTRLEPGARVVGIGTPWHEDDWIGRAIESGEWEWLNLPALAEEDDPLDRVVGEALNRERYDEEYFEKIKLRDPVTFAAMYQGHPTPEDGDVFQKGNLRFFRELPPKEKWGARFATLDLAHSKKQKADFSVLSVWMVTKPPWPRLYWLAMFRDKVSSGDHADWVFGHLDGIDKDFYPRWIVVGDKTFGSSLMDTERKHPRPGKPPFKPVPENEDKWNKAQPAAALTKWGGLWLPEDAPWLPETIHEMMLFPNGAHDDIVDTLSFAGQEYNNQPWAKQQQKQKQALSLEDRVKERLTIMKRPKKLIRLRKDLMR